EGGNRFVDVSAEVGLQHTRWSGDASPVDVNEDGWIDLYVLNMQGDDEYYENVEGKRFVAKGREVFPRTSWGAMGIKVFDFNADGYDDVFIAYGMNFPFRYGINPVLLNNRGKQFLNAEFILGVEPRHGGVVVPWFTLDKADKVGWQTMFRETNFVGTPRDA